MYNNQINTLINKINLFVDNLQNKEEFSHLNITLDIVTDRTISDEIHIESNAYLALKNSIKATNTISDEIRRLKKEIGISDPILVNILLEKKVVLDKKKSKEDNVKKPSAFVATKPKYRLEDVILPKETQEQIDDALAMMENFDKVYKEWNFYSKEPSAKTNICFYGMPGTGKTMCAHGIAQHLNKPILIASYADIQSEYVGVGPKNLQEIFRVAEENNAVLFFDEADSFLRKRTSDTQSSAAMHYNSMTNEMMKHLEDFNGVVIFATNLTENTDEAFKTRISSSIEFKVPDASTRAKLIKNMIPKEVPLTKQFTDEDYQRLSEECEGFVGRDIRNAVKKTLCNGAQTGDFPFIVESFIEGFKSYKSAKEKFDESIKGKKESNVSPLDIYNANGVILSMLTYAVWFDGAETNEEAMVLKKYAKILSRNKPIITKLSDLPELQEMCDEIKDKDMQIKALEYLAEVLAISGEDNKNKELLATTTIYFHLDNTYIVMIHEYYDAYREIYRITNNIK